MTRLLDFAEIRYDNEIVKEAVSFASFENMRKIESENCSVTILSSKGGGLRPPSSSDPEAYKTREGKVGGHKAYLSLEDMQYLDNQIDGCLIGYDYYRSDYIC